MPKEEYCGLCLGRGNMPGCSTLEVSILHLCRFLCRQFQSLVPWRSCNVTAPGTGHGKAPQSKLELSVLLMGTKVNMHGLPFK